MTSRDKLDVVILGASFAGLSVAHNLLNDVFPYLQTFNGAPAYRLVLVAPSSHLYWNIAAPRALVSAELVPSEKMFSPIKKCFEQYSFEDFVFIQGTAGLVDTAQRQVTITLANRPNVDPRESVTTTSTEKTSSSSKASTVKSLKYHALVLATGSSAGSPLLSLHGPHEKTQAAFDDFHKRLRNANSIVIVGGGASGVETAGQLAAYFNSAPRSPAPLPPRPAQGAGPRWRAIRRASPRPSRWSPGTRACCRNLAPALGRRAEEKLRRSHVHILRNTRLVAAAEAPAGQTACHLNDDTTITVDVYDAVPVVLHNLRNDLLAHELHLQYPPAGEGTGLQDRLEELVDEHFSANPTDTLLMPCTKRGEAWESYLISGYRARWCI